MNEPLPRRIAWFAPWAWKRQARMFAVLLMVFVGYPLSVGPMVWLHDRGHFRSDQLVSLGPSMRRSDSPCKPNSAGRRWDVMSTSGSRHPTNPRAARADR